MAMDMSRAQQSIDRWLYSRRAENQSASFGVLPSQIAIESGDVVAVPFAGGTRDVRIIEIKEGDARRLRALTFDRAAFVSGAGGGRTPALTPELIGAGSATLLMDLPMLTDADIEYAGYIAAYANPWSGVNVNRSPTDSAYQLLNTLGSPAVIGFTRFDFYSGPEGRWDWGNELYVEILGRTLSSAAEINVLGGLNACAVENADGEWEVLQFVTATLTDTRQYTLSQLLRGQRGTGYAMRSPVTAGARCIFFDTAIAQINMGTTDVGLEFYFKYGPASQPISSELYETEQFTYTGRGRQPYSPAHPKARKTTADDDIALSWVRRTRIDGDNWEYTVDVPLSESSEAYEIDVWNAGLTAVVRTLTSATESVIYEEADQTTDFGAPPSSVTMDFYQVNDSFGRSPAERKTFTF